MFKRIHSASFTATVLVSAAVAVYLLAPSLAAAALGREPASGLRLAYIDPGAGSFVIQALVATAAGAAVTLRLYWRRIKGFLGLSRGVEEDDDLPPDGRA